MARPTIENRFELLASMGQMPGPPRVEVRRWISQFAQSDRRAAAAVGHSLTFIPEKQFIHQIGDSIDAVDQVLAQISQKPFAGTKEQFLAHCTYCCLDDGRRHLADSAHVISRHLRDTYGVDERRIKTFSQTVRDLFFSRSAFPVLFIDDLLASGEQMTTLWNKRVTIKDGEDVSLAQLHEDMRAAWVFAPVFATSWGIERVTNECAGLAVTYSELVTHRNSLHDNHFADGDNVLADEARAIVSKYHDQYGLPRRPDLTQLGYLNQGLSLAFHHGVPDCTIPLLHVETEGWKPLLRRGTS